MSFKISFDVEFVVSRESEGLRRLEAAKETGTLISFEKRPGDGVAIRNPHSEISDVKIGVALESYLGAMTEQALLEHFSGASLRVGCFVRIDEVASWTMDISPSVLSLLNNLGAELELVVYHCSPDSKEDLTN